MIFQGLLCDFCEAFGWNWFVIYKGDGNGCMDDGIVRLELSREESTESWDENFVGVFMAFLCDS